MLSHTCQNPGCSGSATHPPRIGQLCISCRRRNKSKAYFSPLLFWGMLWVMAWERFGTNRAASEQLGEITEQNTKFWTVEELRLALINQGSLSEPEGLSLFLSEMAVQGFEFPQDELNWLNIYIGAIQPKGQRRVISTYWRLLDPNPIPSGIALQRAAGKGFFRAQVLIKLSAVEKIVKSLVPVTRTTNRQKGQTIYQKRVEHLVLKTPWEVLFPARLRIE